MNHPKLIADSLQHIRHTQPLIHNITNFVTVSFIANALLAIGASPIMAHAEEEICDIVGHANSLVINIGTLDKHWLASMKLAIRAAKAKAIPIVLDPVGVGASAFRTDSFLELLEIALPSVIRGNASEIMALANKHLLATKGVDSQYDSEAAHEAGIVLAKRYQCTVVISGKQDLIINEQQCIFIANGSPLMSRITGMGCTATAIIGAFCAGNINTFEAAVNAMAVMGIAGEMAQQQTISLGHFQAHFINALSILDQASIAAYLKISATQGGLCSI